MVTLAIRFRNQRKKRHPWEIITDPQNGSSYTHKKTLCYVIGSTVLVFKFSLPWLYGNFPDVISDCSPDFGPPVFSCFTCMFLTWSATWNYSPDPCLHSKSLLGNLLMWPSQYLTTICILPILLLLCSSCYYISWSLLRDITLAFTPSLLYHYSSPILLNIPY